MLSAKGYFSPTLKYVCDWRLACHGSLHLLEGSSEVVYSFLLVSEKLFPFELAGIEGRRGCRSRSEWGL